MNLSEETRIAFTLLPRMKQERMSSNDMAVLIATCGLPNWMSRKVLSKLAAKGIVKIRRGQGGGFSLAKPPKHITWLEIIEAMEGELLPVFAGPAAPRCVCHAFHKQIEPMASTMTLADLMSKKTRKENQ